MNQKTISYLAVTTVATIIGIVIGLSVNSDQMAVVQQKTDFPITVAATPPVTQPIKTTITSEVETESTIAKIPVDDKLFITNLVATENVLTQMASAYQLTHTASKARINTLIDILQTVGDDPTSMAISRLFYLRYLNLDPQAAMIKFTRHFIEPTKAQQGVMNDMYHEWGWIDLIGLLDFVTTTAPEKDQHMIIEYLLEDQHFSANQTLLTFANNFSDTTRAMVLRTTYKDETTGQLFERMFAMDIDETTKRKELTRLTSLWAKEDPLAAMVRFMQIPGKGGERLMRNLLYTWASTDPQAALQAAITHELDAKTSSRIFTTMAMTDGNKAIELFNQFSEQLDFEVKDRLMTAWARKAPIEAAAYVEKHPGTAFKNRRTLDSIAWSYARKQPRKAFEWAQRTKLFDKRLARQLVPALVEQDLQSAIELFENLPPGSARMQLFIGLAGQKAKQDLQSARTWLEAHSDEPGYDNALQMLVTQWAKIDPKAAAQNLLSGNITQHKSTLLSVVVYHWYQLTPDEAIKWVIDLPKSQLRDRLLWTVAMQVNSTDKQKAKTLAAELSDEKMRTRLLNQLQSM